MSVELFEQIISQLKGLTDEVTFHLMGEPLTHPLFSDFVEICGRNEMPINLTTNGILVNKIKKREFLFHPAIRQINFSIQSFKDNFPDRDLMSYLRPILTFTKECFDKRPELYLNYRLWNYDSPDELSQRNEEFFGILNSEFGFEFRKKIDLGFRKSFRVQNRLYIHLDSRFEWPRIGGPEIGRTGFCHALSQHFAIHADGSVVPCCLDKEAQINLGSAIEILAALKSDRAQSIREGFASHQLREDLCRRCDFIKRFNKKSPAPRKIAPDRVGASNQIRASDQVQVDSVI